VRRMWVQADMKLQKAADVEEGRSTVVPDGWHTVVVVATLVEFTASSWCCPFAETLNKSTGCLFPLLQKATLLGMATATQIFSLEAAALVRTVQYSVWLQYVTLAVISYQHALKTLHVHAWYLTTDICSRTHQPGNQKCIQLLHAALVAFNCV
jgi:hypothetical protein